MTPALLTPSESRMTTFFLFGIEVAMSIPNDNPSPMAVLPSLAFMLANFVITFSLKGVRYAAVVAPDSKTTMPA